MATALRIGHRDHGRRFSRDELMLGDYESGYQYEVIDGRLYVSPKPNVPHDRVIQQTLAELNAYAFRKPSVVNYVTPNARVFVPGSQFETVPEPDIAAFRDFPDEPETQWEDVSPILVVEVLGGEDDYKDLVRNVELYWRVPSIAEYWLFDIRQDPARPTLRVFRRGAGSTWEILDFAPDDVYATPLLPNFKLPVSAANDKTQTRKRKR